MVACFQGVSMPRGGPQGNRYALRHGGYSRKRRIKKRGIKAIDGRTREGSAVLRWRSDYIDELGGWDNLFTDDKTRINRATITLWELLHIDEYEVEYVEKHGTLVNRRKKTLLPFLLQKGGLEKTLVGYLDRLGHERKAKEIPSLSKALELARGEGQG